MDGTSTAALHEQQQPPAPGTPPATTATAATTTTAASSAGPLRRAIRAAAARLASLPAMVVARRAERHCELLGELCDDIGDEVETLAEKIDSIAGPLPHSHGLNLVILRDWIGTLQAQAANFKAAFTQIRDQGDRTQIRVGNLEAAVKSLRDQRCSAAATAEDTESLRRELAALAQRLDAHEHQGRAEFPPSLN